MGYGGCRIPGHSGTQFKHRTAFSRAKHHRSNLRYKNLDYKASSYPNLKNNVGLIREEKTHPVYKILGDAFKWFTAILFLLCIAGIAYLIYDSSDLSKNESHPEKFLVNLNALYQNDFDKRAYRILNNNGARHLYGNNFDFAQAEFTRALKVNPNGKNARRGLTKILIYKCQTKNQYCEDAQKNIEFLLLKDYATQKEIDKWQKLSLDSLMDEIKDF